MFNWEYDDQDDIETWRAYQDRFRDEFPTSDIENPTDDDYWQFLGQRDQWQCQYNFQIRYATAMGLAWHGIWQTENDIANTFDSGKSTWKGWN